MLIVHLLVDVRDTMGANTVNTNAEHIAPIIDKLTNGKTRFKILSNWADKRRVSATATLNAQQFSTDAFEMRWTTVWVRGQENPACRPSSICAFGCSNGCTTFKDHLSCWTVAKPCSTASFDKRRHPTRPNGATCTQYRSKSWRNW